MGKKQGSERGRARLDTTEGSDRRTAVLSTSVEVMRWRLQDAATRIEEAADAIARHHPDRALERLLDLEPLVFDVQRVLSAVFLLARETGTGRSDRS